MRLLRHLIAALFATAMAATALMADGTAHVWTGAAGDGNYNNPANWTNRLVPPGNGTATIVFGDAANTHVTLPLVLDVAQIQFTNSPGKPYLLDASLLTFITVRNGLSLTQGGPVRMGENITFSLSGTQTFEIGSGSLEIAGGFIGNGSLIKTGGGQLRLDGFNLLNGTTHVEAGALLFANTYSLPTGTISAGSLGYVGAEDANTLKLMLGQLDSEKFAGIIGLDSAPGASSTSAYSDQIDLTRIPHQASIGSTSSAKLTGNLRVSPGQDYRFGGGAGTLYVQSNLTNYGSGLSLTSAHGSPLSLYLQGSNNFGGALHVLNSVLVLDSHQAVASNKILTIDGPGYIGSTERFATSSAGFLSLLSTSNANAIAGFDSANISAPRTLTENIDLSAGGTRNDPYYLGTSTKVTLTGNLTPTTGDSLYLTAVKGGHLVVGSKLGTGIPGLVVGQAASFDPQGGIVELTGTNNYTGGTKVLGGTLRASNNSALGTGAVEVGGGATFDVNAGTSINNKLAIAPGGRLSGRGSIGTPGGVLFGPGAILSPGGKNSIGSLTFNTPVNFGVGSVIEFDIGSTTGGPGKGWDSIDINGLLNLAAPGGSLITLDLTTLTSGGTAGLLAGFDPAKTYSWLFLTADNVTGFSNEKFLFDTSGFANNLGGGGFFISQNNTGLSINFTPVPEPGTNLLLGLGIGFLILRSLRRRKA